MLRAGRRTGPAPLRAALYCLPWPASLCCAAGGRAGLLCTCVWGGGPAVDVWGRGVRSGPSIVGVSIFLWPALPRDSQHNESKQPGASRSSTTAGSDSPGRGPLPVSRACRRLRGAHTQPCPTVDGQGFAALGGLWLSRASRAVPTQAGLAVLGTVGRPVLTPSRKGCINLRGDALTSKGCSDSDSDSDSGAPTQKGCAAFANLEGLC